MPPVPEGLQGQAPQGPNPNALGLQAPHGGQPRQNIKGYIVLKGNYNIDNPTGVIYRGFINPNTGQHMLLCILILLTWLTLWRSILILKILQLFLISVSSIINIFSFE